MQKIWVHDTLIHRRNPFKKMGNYNYLIGISVHGHSDLNRTHRIKEICEDDETDVCLSDTSEEEKQDNKIFRINQTYDRDELKIQYIRSKT